MNVLLRNKQHPDYDGVHLSLGNTEFSIHILPVDILIRWYLCNLISRFFCGPADGGLRL